MMTPDQRAHCARVADLMIELGPHRFDMGDCVVDYAGDNFVSPFDLQLIETNLGPIHCGSTQCIGGFSAALRGTWPIDEKGYITFDEEAGCDEADALGLPSTDLFFQMELTFDEVISLLRTAAASGNWDHLVTDWL